jgi:Carbohydrate family 9 binding domain-like/Secretion system C-terminal sorting domain
MNGIIAYKNYCRYIFLLVQSLGLVLLAPPLFSVQDDTVRVYNVAIAPVIDGIGDDAGWGNADWQTIDQVWINYGEFVEKSDYSGRYKIVWSSQENLLYFLIETTDDVAIGGFIEGQTADVYNYDISEVFIDENKSGGPHINDNPQTGENAENAFAYHIYCDFPEEGGVTHEHWVGDIPGPHTEHIPEFALRKTGDLYTREFSLKVYNENYDDNDPEASRVVLTKDKVMGLSVAYCDNDENDGQRDNFFGSVWVPKANYNNHWMNADDFGTAKLYSELTPGSIKGNQCESSIEIYPNPASDYIHIEADQAVSKFEIVDLSGNTKSVFYLHGKEKQRISVSHLIQGIYYTRITTEDNTFYGGKLLIL